MESEKVKIRFAQVTDVASIIELCKAHAIYEKAEYSKKGKANQISKDIFSSNPKLYCLVVENDIEIIAYATYMKQYATWDAAEYIYMDCLYVKEKHRSKGIGEELINRIKLEGANLGCTIVQWQTPNFNKGAIKFYTRIGANCKSKERFFLNISK
ncbi:GNAT family N-acetyltransferase [Winogradskyella flava]|uniref:GNAT family N-acetyltransferase n=1 Tax=Winogradskyella flava TaxID=1884876 RepID=UPI0024934C7B|nr:GNAT family N-acetyltransferase [Winogradskyella flava]